MKHFNMRVMIVTLILMFIIFSFVQYLPRGIIVETNEDINNICPNIDSDLLKARQTDDDHELLVYWETPSYYYIGLYGHTFRLRIENAGNVSESYDLFIYLDNESNLLDMKTHTLEPGEIQIVDQSITATEGFHTLIAKVVTSTAEYSATKEFLATSQNIHMMDIDVLHPYYPAIDGGTWYIQINITNLGNSWESLDVRLYINNSLKFLDEVDVSREGQANSFTTLNVDMSTLGTSGYYEVYCEVENEYIKENITSWFRLLDTKVEGFYPAVETPKKAPEANITFQVDIFVEYIGQTNTTGMIQLLINGTEVFTTEVDITANSTWSQAANLNLPIGKYTLELIVNSSWTFSGWFQVKTYRHDTVVVDCYVPTGLEIDLNAGSVRIQFDCLNYYNVTKTLTTQVTTELYDLDGDLLQENTQNLNSYVLLPNIEHSFHHLHYPNYAGVLHVDITCSYPNNTITEKILINVTDQKYGGKLECNEYSYDLDYGNTVYADEGIPADPLEPVPMKVHVFNYYSYTKNFTVRITRPNYEYDARIVVFEQIVEVPKFSKRVINASEFDYSKENIISDWKLEISDDTTTSDLVFYWRIEGLIVDIWIDESVRTGERFSFTVDCRNNQETKSIQITAIKVFTDTNKLLYSKNLDQIEDETLQYEWNLGPNDGYYMELSTVFYTTGNRTIYVWVTTEDHLYKSSRVINVYGSDISRSVVNATPSFLVEVVSISLVIIAVLHKKKRIREV